MPRLTTAFGMLALCAAAGFSQPAPPPAPPPPTIVLSADSATVTDLTPGGAMAWYSLSRFPLGYTTRTVQRAGMETADPTGTVELAFDEPLSPIAVWLAIDLTTGRFTLADGGLGAFREVGFPGQSLVRGPQGKLNRFVHTRPYLELFLARPGVGAWTLVAGEGAEGDDDGTLNGSLRVALAAMAPVDSSPEPPEELEAKDVLLIVDPRAMELMAVELVR